MTLPPPPWPAVDRTALFLDVDGTLAEFRRRPDEVGPTQRLTALLRALVHRFGGRVAMISGRALWDVDRITERAVEAASGVHGLERRTARGKLEAAPPHPALAQARAEFSRLVDDHPDLLLEDKGLGLVLHYRTAPALEALARETAETLSRRSGLALQLGDMMAEVRTPGRDKGDALRAFMAEPPFAGAQPVYVGDDVTDEDAFRAAHDLGGFGVLVGPARETHAAFRLPHVAPALDWLEALAAAPAVAA